MKEKPDLLIYGFELSEVGFSDFELECLGDIRAVGIYQLKRSLKREQIETVVRVVLEDIEIANFQALAGSREEGIYSVHNEEGARFFCLTKQRF